MSLLVRTIAAAVALGAAPAAAEVSTSGFTPVSAMLSASDDAPGTGTVFGQCFFTTQLDQWGQVVGYYQAAAAATTTGQLSPPFVSVTCQFTGGGAGHVALGDATVGHNVATGTQLAPGKPTTICVSAYASWANGVTAQADQCRTGLGLHAGGVALDAQVAHPVLSSLDRAGEVVNGCHDVTACGAGAYAEEIGAGVTRGRPTGRVVVRAGEREHIIGHEDENALCDRGITVPVVC